MSYYWLIISLPIMLSSVRIDKYKHLNSFLWFIFSFILILFLGFRSNVGGDWWVYNKNFIHTGENFNIPNFDLRSDYLFELLSWNIYIFGFNLIALNLVCTVIFVYAITSFCAKQKQPWLAMVIASTEDQSTPQ